MTCPCRREILMIPDPLEHVIQALLVENRAIGTNDHACRFVQALHFSSGFGDSGENGNSSNFRGMI